MKPKMGRPLKGEPLNDRIQIRADKKTIEMLDYCAKEKATNRSEIVRQGIELVYAETKKSDNT